MADEIRFAIDAFEPADLAPLIGRNVVITVEGKSGGERAVRRIILGTLVGAERYPQSEKRSAAADFWPRIFLKSKSTVKLNINDAETVVTVRAV